MDLAAWEIAALIIAGMAGGFINVMAGGGSVITVPVMIFLGVPGPIVFQFDENIVLLSIQKFLLLIYFHTLQFYCLSQ